MERGYRRRNYFINQELQGKMIFVIFLLSILGVALFTLIFSLLSTDYLTISYTEQQFRVGDTPAVLIKELFQANWLFILLGGGLVSVVMLFVSHAFAGPLYRFESVFKRLNDRDLNQQIHLRDKDIGKNLAQEINAFVLQYSADIAQLQHLSAELEKQLECGELENAKDYQKKIDKIIGGYNIKSEE